MRTFQGNLTSTYVPKFVVFAVCLQRIDRFVVKNFLERFQRCEGNFVGFAERGTFDELEKK